MTRVKFFATGFKRAIDEVTKVLPKNSLIHSVNWLEIDYMLQKAYGLDIEVQTTDEDGYASDTYIIRTFPTASNDSTFIKSINRNGE